MPRLSVEVVKDYEALSRTGANLVAAAISTNTKARVVLATGETPMGLYRELARKTDEGSLDASGITVCLLDEYVGIGPDDHRSLFGWALRSFCAPLGIPEGNVIRLPANGDPAACVDYDRTVEQGGGYDFAILGVGTNGHIGFNEPPSDASAPTREVELSAESIRSNALYWGGEQHVPRRAITIGMEPLLRARAILLVASGSHKRDILRRAVLGPETPDVPASYLRRAQSVTVLVDHESWEAR